MDKITKDIKYVKCINESDFEWQLTLDKTYEVINYVNCLVYIKNDIGKVGGYFENRFVPIEEHDVKNNVQKSKFSEQMK